MKLTVCSLTKLITWNKKINKKETLKRMHHTAHQRLQEKPRIKCECSSFLNALKDEMKETD